ncbi:MAG: transposase [Thiohalorhabdus sp.]|uniref:transposase n=1 Tax=Thiohalorhabdus sp. TaxID=3094134 RepID=UPI003980D0E3
MARTPRIHVPGGFYYVTLLGNGEQTVVADEAERAHLEDLVGEGTYRFGHRIHAYCWEPSRLHLLLEVDEVPLPKIMQNLSFRFTRRANKHRGRSGHLFQGRYKALLLDPEAYLLQMVRYIHARPATAGLATDPASYPWSGHRAYLDEEQVGWLTRERVLAELADRPGRARREYARFVEEGLAGPQCSWSPLEAAQGGCLGGADFRTRQGDPPEPPQPLAGRIAAVEAAVSGYFGLSVERLRSGDRGHLASRARAVVAYLAIETGASTLSEAAERMNRDVATMSNAVGRLRGRLAFDPRFAAEVDRLREHLHQAAGEEA